MRVRYKKGDTTFIELMIKTKFVVVLVVIR